MKAQPQREPSLTLSALDLPQDVRLKIWEYLKLEDYVSLAFSCRLLRDDREQLDPTRVVTLHYSEKAGLEEKLSQSKLLSGRSPVCLRLHSQTRLWKASAALSLSAVTTLDATNKPLRLGGLLQALPRLEAVHLSPHESQGWQLRRNLKRVVWRETVGVIHLTGENFQFCNQLEELDVTGGKLIRLPWYAMFLGGGGNNRELFPALREMPLKRVFLKKVGYRESDQTLSQAILKQFVRQHGSTLKVFESDLSETSVHSLRADYPCINFR